MYADPLKKLVGSRPAHNGEAVSEVLTEVITLNGTCGVVHCQKHVKLLNNLFFYLNFYTGYGPGWFNVRG